MKIEKTLAILHFQLTKVNAFDLSGAFYPIGIKYVFPVQLAFVLEIGQKRRAFKGLTLLL